MGAAEWLSLGQLFVLLATGGVVAWYTAETYKLRQTAQKQLDSQGAQLAAQLEQIETQVRPFVIFRPDQGRGTLSLENVGFGPAFNVGLDDILIHEKIEGHPLVLRFPERVPVLKPGVTVTIPVSSRMGDADFGDFFSAALNPEFNLGRIEVVITYDNVQMKRYRVTQVVEPKSLQVIGFAPDSRLRTTDHVARLPPAGSGDQ